MEALRSSPIVRPPSKLQRLAPGSPYPSDLMVDDSGTAASVGPALAVPPGFENGSGDAGTASASLSAGAGAQVPSLPGFGGPSQGAPFGDNGLGKVESMFAEMMTEMKSVQGSVQRMEGGMQEVKQEVGKLRLDIGKAQHDIDKNQAVM